jgi:DNA invertase Pin-like site-specific DNA recombinase
MSTERQEYSLDNQAEALDQFAQENGFSIVKTYQDAGKSGLTVRERSGLKELLSDVLTGHAEFTAILVYDVSRWGRFQDLDEAAHYEFLCKAAGIPIHYAAEQFGSGNSMGEIVLKALKRTMAAEYSRELGVRVFAGKRRLAALGFHQAGLPGYGLKRVMVPAEPGLNLVQILEGSKNGLLKALYVVGSNPVARYHVDPFVLRATFLVVQDLFLTETAQLADVVLPAASAYEKSGTLIAFSSRSRSGRRPQCVVRKPQACESLGSDRRHIRSGCRPENLAGGTRAGVPHVAMHVLLSVYGGLSTIHRWYGFCGRCHY